MSFILGISPFITIPLAYLVLGILTALFVLIVMRESPVAALVAMAFWPLFWLAGIYVWIFMAR